MKKTISLLIALVLTTVMLASLAMATDGTNTTNEEYYLLDGQVTAIGDGYVMIVLDGSEYQINVTEETILEGTEKLAIGDWLQVVHNGQMTRSLPPQVAAQVIRSYSVTGTVSGLTENSFTLTDENGMEVVVNFDPDRFVGVQDTMQVTVWFDGMMSRSLPAQITAEHIRTQVLTGVITEVTEDGFMVVDDNGILTFVHVSEATRIFTELAVDAAIRVTTDGTATMSLPAQVTAIEVLPAEEAAETAEEPVIEG